MRVLLLSMLAVTLILQSGADGFPAFKEHVVNPDAEVVYAVAAADMNRDGKVDIVGASATFVAWYENPSWTPHRICDQLINDNVCFDLRDLDADGIPEMAIGADWQPNNTNGGGALYFARHNGDPAQPWTVTPLLAPIPTLHRIRWADVNGDAKFELVVSPLKGVGSKMPAFMDKAVRLFVLYPSENLAAPWREETIEESLHIVHNIWPIPAGPGPQHAILAASMEGVTRFDRDPAGKWTATNLNEFLTGAPSKDGAGEIKTSSGSRPRYATIEPWHGNQVVVYAPLPGAPPEASTTYKVLGVKVYEKTGPPSYGRYVIDDTYKGGHAVYWADFNVDGQDDLLAGYREKSGPKDTFGLYVYTLKNEPGDTILEAKHTIDEGGMATEDAIAADINGDGRMDIVAGGRATHNIKWYENLGDTK